MMGIRKLQEGIKSTLKSEDTEGFFEIYVTRSCGYLWALLFKHLHVHPNVVTLISIVLGALAGYMFYFDDLVHTLWGILLLVWANWYDCADGQLARMTGQKSLLGRILDGFAGDVWFFSIYFFICLRLSPQWGCWIWVLAFFAGAVCHSKQCALSDYYRNVHLYFQKGAAGSELDTSVRQHEKMQALSWRENWFEKLYLLFYTRYTRSQERMSPCCQRLLEGIRHSREGKPGSELCRQFRQGSKPLMKYTNILTFDTRAAVLFLSVLCGKPWVFLLFEVTVLNVLFFYMRYRHERLCRGLYAEFYGSISQEP